MIGSFILLALALYFILAEKAKGLLTVVIISLTNDLFVSPLGFSISIYHVIALLYLPITFVFFYKQAPKKIKYIISPLILEIIYLISLAIIFGFIFPREDFNSNRSWRQTANGRTLVT